MARWSYVTGLPLQTIVSDLRFSSTRDAIRKTGVVCAYLALQAWASVAGPIQPIAPDFVQPRWKPISADRQRFAGSFASRLRANSEGFLEHVGASFLLARADGQAGLYLIAASAAYSYSADASLRKGMDEVANRLEERKPNSFAISLERLHLAGLLAYYQATGDEKAYDAARLIGDWFLQQSSEQVSLSTAAPLIDLYRFTAEPSFLSFARQLIEKAYTFGEVRPSRTGTGPEGAATLDTLTAAVQYHLATGDPAALRWAEAAWQTFAGRNSSLLGVPLADNDIAVDGCFAAAWTFLTEALFSATANPRYGGELERLALNILPAAQDTQSGHLCASISLQGAKVFEPPTMPSTCALSLAGALASLPHAVWGMYGKGIAINLYSAGRGTFQLERRALVQIYAETSYPEKNEILLHIEPSHNVRFPLYLRVPEWTDRFTADYEGAHLLGKPGQTFVITRQWKRGDVVRLSIGMPAATITVGRRAALRRGPVVLAQLDPKRQLPLTSDMLSSLQNLSQSFPRYTSDEQQFSITAQVDGKSQTIELEPFSRVREGSLWFKARSVEAPPN